jgi:hypothetical protein
MSVNPIRPAMGGLYPLSRLDILMNKIKSLIIGGLIFSSAVPTMGVQAANLARKAPMLTLIGSNAILGVNDNGQPGPTPGDIRTLSLTMSDTQGNQVGNAEIVQTLTRQQGEIGTAVKVTVIELPKGTLTVIGNADFVNFTSPTARPTDTNEELAVVGGTGIYRGVGGQVDIQVLPDFKSRWVIRLKY